MSKQNRFLHYKNKIKTLSVEIKNLKSSLKDAQRANQHTSQEQWELAVHQYGMRHLYLAYALDRGMSLEKVEKVCYKKTDLEQIEMNQFNHQARGL